MRTIRGLGLLIVAALVGVAAADDRGTDLEVPGSIFANGEGLLAKYDYFVGKVLLKDSHYAPHVRMLVRPSWCCEWMVEIEKPTGDTAIVRYVVANRSIWHGAKPRATSVTTLERTVDAATAGSLRDAWMHMLERTTPRQPAVGFDGATYLFMAFVQGRGNIEGEVWSPPNDSPTGRLVGLGTMLRDYVSVDSRPTVTSEALRQAAETLVAERSMDRDSKP